MNRTVSLSQFMPYGAPDLLASGPRDLSRATVASSVLAVVAFLVALWLAPSWTPVPLRVIAVTPGHAPTLVVPRRLPPPPGTTPIRSRSFPDEGIIRPVVEPSDPPLAVEPEGTGAIEGEPTRILEQPVGVPGDREEPYPDRRDAIYVDELPAAVTEVKPDYPTFAKEAGIEGLVIVHALVGKDGRVVKVEVSEKFSILALDDAALAAARGWVFKPALTNNRPVAVWVAIPFKFRLH